MYTVTFSRSRVEIPARWAEFAAGDRRFIAVAGELGRFDRGETDFARLRIGLAVALLGIRPRRFRDGGEADENIYRVAETIEFPFRTEELPDGRTAVSLNVIIDRNLLPALRGVDGYRFSVQSDGQVDCTLTADTYIDCLSLMQAYGDAHQMRTLGSLAELLYPGISAKRPTDDELFAVYFNFRGILSWLRALPTFALIFSSTAAPERVAAANPVGLAAGIFSLAKAGYGDIDTIRNLPLLSYLSLLVQQTIDSVKALEAAKLKPTEIADRLHLPTELILPITAQ